MSNCAGKYSTLAAHLTRKQTQMQWAILDRKLQEFGDSYELLWRKNPTN